jgi:hypothetical protein
LPTDVGSCIKSLRRELENGADAELDVADLTPDHPNSRLFISCGGSFGSVFDPAEHLLAHGETDQRHRLDEEGAQGRV